MNRVRYFDLLLIIKYLYLNIIVFICNVKRKFDGFCILKVKNELKFK